MPRFTFAHLSDPHLPLLAEDIGRWWRLGAKRAGGVLSWQRGRRHRHLPPVLSDLLADVARHRPDHIVVTGDIVNVALPGEFVRAEAWLAGLGAPGEVTLVPGNHDAYVRMPPHEGIGRWSAYMAGDEGGAAGFPAVRRRGPVAFVGLSTAEPRPMFFASGRLGAAQLARLAETLDALGAEGLCRVVLIHHPPGVAGASRRRGLVDRAAFAAVLARHGAELVLHGHTHMSQIDSLRGPCADIPVLGTSSASAAHGHRTDPARWQLVAVERAPSGGFRIDVTVRGLDAAGEFVIVRHLPFAFDGPNTGTAPGPDATGTARIPATASKPP